MSQITTDYRVNKKNQPNPSKVSVFWIGSTVYSRNLETGEVSTSGDFKDESTFLKLYAKAEKAFFN